MATVKCVAVGAFLSPTTVAGGGGGGEFASLGGEKKVHARGMGPHFGYRDAISDAAAVESLDSETSSSTQTITGADSLGAPRGVPSPPVHPPSQDGGQGDTASSSSSIYPPVGPSNPEASSTATETLVAGITAAPTTTAAVAGTTATPDQAAAAAAAAAGTGHEPLNEIHRVTIALLGAHGSGKTSLVRQFVYNDFTEEYRITRSHSFYHVSVVVNERLYEVKFVDCSSVVRFPANSLQEWNEQRGSCLRNASAYLLVYDVTDDESFRYARSMRDQIFRTRDVRNVPIFVAANKQDLVMQALQTSNSHGSAAGGGGGSGGGGGVTSSECAVRIAKNREAQANAIKKQWKCGFVECSSKYNWRVTTVFRELMRAVDHTGHGHRAASHRVQDALRIDRCVIL